MSALDSRGLERKSGLNLFTMIPGKWIDRVNAIGIVAQSGRNGGTHARNAVKINDSVLHPQRLKKLNEIAIQQMRILSEVKGRKYLK